MAGPPPPLPSPPPLPGLPPYGGRDRPGPAQLAQPSRPKSGRVSLPQGPAITWPGVGTLLGRRLLGQAWGRCWAGDYLARRGDAAEPAITWPGVGTLLHGIGTLYRSLANFSNNNDIYLIVTNFHSNVGVRQVVEVACRPSASPTRRGTTRDNLLLTG